jgi:DNA polymerase-3 subunit alpha
MGIRLLPPDINRSGADFSVERQKDGTLAIRYALAAVKKVGFAAMQSVVAARGGQPFEDLADFAARIDPRALNRMQIENLARAGAFDSLDDNRNRVFAGADVILRRAQARSAEASSGQIGLFAGGNRPEPLRLPDVPDTSPLERLAFEAEAIGFHLTAHPMDAYAAPLRRLGVIPSNRLIPGAASGRVKLAGTVVARKDRITRTGSRMCWLRLSDAQGSYEVTVFSEVLARARDIISDGAMLLVTADLRQEGESLRITAQDIVPLDQAAASTGGGLRVFLHTEEAVRHIAALLRREGKGKGRVFLCPRLDTRQRAEISLPGSYNVSPRLAQAVKSLAGVERVEEI